MINLFEQILFEFVNQRAALPGDEGYRNSNFYSIKPDGKLQYYPQGPTSRSRQQNLSQGGHRQASTQDVQTWENWFNPDIERPRGVRTWSDYQDYLKGGMPVTGAGGDNPLEPGTVPPPGGGGEGPPPPQDGPMGAALPSPLTSPSSNGKEQPAAQPTQMEK